MDTKISTQKINYYAHIVWQERSAWVEKLSSSAMLAGNFAPAFLIDLVAKDFGLMEVSAKAISADVPLSRAIGAIFRAAKKEGFGGDNITGIVQRYSGSN